MTCDERQQQAHKLRTILAREISETADWEASCA